MQVTVESNVDFVFDELRRRAAVTKGLRAGIKVFKTALVAACPPEYEKSAFTKKYGSLKSNIKYTIRVSDNGQSGTARLGFGKLNIVAYWVEYGHKILGHISALLPNAKLKVRLKVENVPPHPFVRPVFDTTAEAAIAAFKEAVIKSYNEPLRVRGKKIL